jgi:Fic family protein
MNKAGKYVSNLSGEYEYKSFLPAPLPPVIEMDREMTALLVEANKQIYALESITSHIPSIKLFTSMYVRKEALMSSQIEGTQATLEDVLDPTLDQNANRDLSDVVNYVKATDYAVERLKEFPLCNRFIREVHAVLMNSVRGCDKSPGEFRSSQNWIGGAGSTLKNARYIPPNPTDMIECMSDLEKYINEDDELDMLIKAALIHYQFESIHPFLDGNGRVGRLLITLFLMEKKVLSSPALYISYYLKSNRIEYYDRMSEVRLKGNYEQWIKFFLRAIAESAKDAILTINELSKLHEENYAKLQALGRAKTNAIKLFAYVEHNPIIDIQKTADALNLSYNTVNAAIKNLSALSILERNESSSKKTFVYKAYVDILKKGTE